MTRRVFASAFAVLLSLASVSQVFAQATAAAPQPPSPPARAKWIPPVKGLATIEVIRGASRRVGNEMVTTLKIKNTSKGAIALLGIEEYWYNKERNQVSYDEQKVKKLFNPGEVIEVTSRAPWKPDLYNSQFAFSHANGKIDAKSVKKFTEE